MQSCARHALLFPKRSLDDPETEQFVIESVKLGGRALYLVPDDRSADKVRATISSALGYSVFDASQIEESKTPFVQSNGAVAVVANRYDGIDLINDECRLLLADGLPGGANLQERFFVLRVTAQLLLGVCRELRVSRHQFERGCRWNRAIRSSGRRLLEPCPR